MAVTTLSCEQAIFTSIRTPMGEGYRVVAASGGLRPDEKQAITRYSPSHDALCRPGKQNADACGVAFYRLPGGRHCVALSRYAGAEHTGRGGQRVYTYNAVYDEQDFPRCAYNPFAVLRAMARTLPRSPELKPPPVLPPLQLTMNDETLEPAGPTAVLTGRQSPFDAGTRRSTPDLRGLLCAAWRAHILGALLDERSLIVNLPNGWVEAAEAMLLGIPGPMRREISFSAGLKFSVGRCHRLSLLHDDHGTARSRTAGRPVNYVEPAAQPEPVPPTSSWVSFVERHWAGGAVSTLARRTSRPFSDTGAVGRERVGRLYNHIDAVPSTDTAALLDIAVAHLNEPDCGVEGDIVAELVVSAQRTLLERFDKMRWAEAGRHLDRMCSIPRRSAEARLFVEPLIEQVLRAAAQAHPAVAAEAALRIAQDLAPGPAGADVSKPAADLAATVLARLAEWAEHAADDELAELPEVHTGFEELVSRWQTLRPRCPIVRRLYDRCARASSATN